MIRSFDLLSSLLASTARTWRGTSGSKSVTQPKKNIILFDREGDPECRFVREALTELNLDILIAPCPEGGRNIRKLKRDSGSDELPLLVDENTNQKLRGREQIIAYLYQQYRGASIPEHFKRRQLTTAASKLSSLVRFNKGMRAKESLPAEKPLTLYSFESSPYSRLVRELLCELELPYRLINLGKQQWADMGPAYPRLIPGEYKPLKNTKRDTFFKKHGNVQVPYLIDPNTGRELFESQDIIAYLNLTYFISEKS